jgi:hypothetical protein
MRRRRDDESEGTTPVGIFDGLHSKYPPYVHILSDLMVEMLQVKPQDHAEVAIKTDRLHRVQTTTKQCGDAAGVSYSGKLRVYGQHKYR